MNYYVLTLFPEMIADAASVSILGRAQKSEAIRLDLINIRDFSTNKHNRVDDYPYGGGAGMLIEAEPVYRAIQEAKRRAGKKTKVVYLTPQAKVLDQEKVEELAREEDLILLCGHYEGIDERVLEEEVTDHISIGDYVLTGGELAALVLMDAVSRFVPGVLSNDESARFDSLSDGLLEYPQYTRPEIWRDKRVPPILLSGDHKKVDEWRHEQSLQRTLCIRPDLLRKNFVATHHKEKKRMKIFKCDDYEQLSRRAAYVIASQIAQKPDSILGFATGSSPIGTYQVLIDLCKKGLISFKDVTTYNLDEYCGIPIEHPESYRGFMNRQLFDHIDIDKANTHVPDGLAEDLDAAAKAYDDAIKAAGNVDLQLLGIGHDGHIGFNEPDCIFPDITHVVELTEMTINANKRFFDDDPEQVPKRAVSMGIGTIMRAKKIVLVANGEDKKEIFKKAFFGPVTPEVPASILQFHPDVTIFWC